MNTSIICKISNSLNSNGFNILIYKNNELIFNNITDINGTLKLNLLKGVYKIIIISPLNITPSIVYSSFIIKDNLKMSFIFSNVNIYPYKKIIINMHDNYYKLPIKKGKIILWQDHIQ